MSLSGGELLELDADRITKRGTYRIGMRTREVAVSGERLWVCARRGTLDLD